MCVEYPVKGLKIIILMKFEWINGRNSKENWRNQQ